MWKSQTYLFSTYLHWKTLNVDIFQGKYEANDHLKITPSQRVDKSFSVSTFYWIGLQRLPLNKDLEQLWRKNSKPSFNTDLMAERCFEKCFNSHWSVNFTQFRLFFPQLALNKINYWTNFWHFYLLQNGLSCRVHQYSCFAAKCHAAQIGIIFVIFCLFLYCK